METNADRAVRIFDGRSHATGSDDQIALLLTWQLEEEEPGRAWPTRPLNISGHDVHLCALRVMEIDGVQYAWHPDPDNDESSMQGELDAIQSISESKLQAYALPGLEGEWVILAHSFGD